MESSAKQQILLTDIVDAGYYNGHPIYFFYKRVKSSDISHHVIVESSKKRMLEDIISKILSFTNKERNISELKLTENRKNWVMWLLDYISQESSDDKLDKIIEMNATSLLNDFSEGMNSRMREQEKYTVLILKKDMLLLCHTRYGENTLTPDWQIIPRMLDTDNIMRYVAFIKTQSGIVVKYYEEYKSKFLVEWLGLSKKESCAYLGGKYRIESDINGVKITLEFSQEELHALINGSLKGLKLNGNSIIFENPISSLPINAIRVGKRPHRNINDFIQNFIVEYWSIDHIIEMYNKAISFDMHIYEIIDGKEEIIYINKSDGSRVTKPKNFDNIIPIFTTEGIIEIEEDFIEYLTSKLMNYEDIAIFHPGDKFSSNPIQVKSMKIYNNLDISGGVDLILDKINCSENGTSIIDRLLIYAGVKILEIKNKDKKIFYFLKKLSSKFLEVIKIDTGKLLLKKEDEIVEFKARDFFEGKDEQIIDRISKDLNNKFSENSLKIYFIGFDEKDGNIELIGMSRLRSERMNTLGRRIKEATNAKDIQLIPIPVYENKGFLILIAIK